MGGEGGVHLQDNLERQPIGEHIAELRSRLIYSIIFLVVGVLVAWNFHGPLFEWLIAPFQRAMAVVYPELSTQVSFRSVIEPFSIYLRTAVTIGAIATAPLMMHQAWLFVAPGLYDHERRSAIPFLIFSYLCFLGGVLFCRYVVLDPALVVLLQFALDSSTPAIMMEEYFSFTTRVLFVFGTLFELPVVVSALAIVGVVNHRMLIDKWRYATVAAAIVGAMLTPPDPFTMLALGLPLMFLYGISIVFAWIITSARERKHAKAE